MTRDFIEPGTSASYWDWLLSKGTNQTCYEIYKASLTDERKIDNTIEVVRTIIYSMACPLQFTFFYWSILLFILHKFNFNKPVLKIILYHFIFRCIGDILNKLGNLMPRYYANVVTVENGVATVTDCQIGIDMSEKHPLKWLITRQFAVIFWFTGEIFADWYPLLRTRAVAREAKSMWLVYTTCILFNLSKISMMIYHFTLSPTKLYNQYGAYDEARVTDFYYTYWIIHLIIIYASVIYDFSVFYVLKRNVFGVQSEIGFLKKFRSMSEFRISISVIICIVFLPLISTTIILKYYYMYKGYKSLNFSFDEIRQLIANVQYFMIFIDQILLIISKEEYQHNSSYNTNQPYPSGYYYSSKSNLSNNSGNYNGFNNSNNNVGLSHSNSVNTNGLNSINNNNNNNIFKNSINNNNNNNIFNSSINDNNKSSNIHFQNLMKMNNGNDKPKSKLGQYEDNIEYTPIMHTPLLNYNSNNASFANQNIRTTQEMTKLTPSTINNFNSYKKKTMADYDDYNGPNSDEWNYLS